MNEQKTNEKRNETIASLYDEVKAVSQREGYSSTFAFLRQLNEKQLMELSYMFAKNKNDGCDYLQAGICCRCVQPYDAEKSENMLKYYWSKYIMSDAGGSEFDLFKNVYTRAVEYYCTVYETQQVDAEQIEYQLQLCYYTYRSREQWDCAFKMKQVLARYADTSGYWQFSLAEEYFNKETESNDLAAALYWYDKAYDKAADARKSGAAQSRDDILDHLAWNLTESDCETFFHSLLEQLDVGNGDIPIDIKKKKYWVKVRDNTIKKIKQRNEISLTDMRESTSESATQQE